MKKRSILGRQRITAIERWSEEKDAHRESTRRRADNER